jgi:hypothetical protein
VTGRILVELNRADAEELVRGQEWVAACRRAWLRAADVAARHWRGELRLHDLEAEAHDRYRQALLTFAMAAERIAIPVDLALERRRAIETAPHGGLLQ